MVMGRSLSRGEPVVVELQGNHEGTVAEGTARGYAGSIQYRKSRGSSCTGHLVVEICNDVHIDSVWGALQCTIKTTNSLRHYSGGGHGIQEKPK